MKHQHPTMTTITMVFGNSAGTAGLPADVIMGILDCDDCFIRYYGEHLTDQEIANPKQRLPEQDFHLAHCAECRYRQRRLTPASNKMGVSNARYKAEIGV